MMDRSTNSSAEENIVHALTVSLTHTLGENVPLLCVASVYVRGRSLDDTVSDGLIYVHTSLSITRKRNKTQPVTGNDTETVTVLHSRSIINQPLGYH